MFKEYKKNKKEKNTYAIIGLGRFGMPLAKELALANVDLIVLDSDEEKVREMREYTEEAYVIKNLDKKSLMEAGVQNSDIAIVCIGEKIDTSVLTTSHLVSMNIPHVISKAMSADHGLILEKLGAEVVYPERDIAIRLAHRLENSLVIDYIQLSEKLNITKLQVSEKMIGRSIQQINFRGKYGVNIIAIENGKDLTENILPDYVIKEKDILFVSGSKNGLNKLSENEK